MDSSHVDMEIWARAKPGLLFTHLPSTMALLAWFPADSPQSGAMSVCMQTPVGKTPSVPIVDVAVLEVFCFRATH